MENTQPTIETLQTYGDLLIHDATDPELLETATTVFTPSFLEKVPGKVIGNIGKELPLTSKLKPLLTKEPSSKLTSFFRACPKSYNLVYSLFFEELWLR